MIYPIVLTYKKNILNQNHYYQVLTKDIIMSSPFIRESTHIPIPIISLTEKVSSTLSETSSINMNVLAKYIGF